MTDQKPLAMEEITIADWACLPLSLRRMLIDHEARLRVLEERDHDDGK
jgi:hypothetical protein